MQTTAHTHQIAGCTVRWATPADTPGIEDFYGTVFAEASGAYNHQLVGYLRGLLGGTHPHGRAADVAIAVHPDGSVVAAAVLLRMPMTYGGIALQVGRPDLIGCREAFRGQGIVAALLTLIHARSAAHGDLAQFISGIPYYYRRYGYEYAVALGGSRIYPLDGIRVDTPQADDSLQFRPATPADIPALCALAAAHTTRGTAATPILAQSQLTEAYWAYLLSPAAAQETWFPWMVCDQSGAVVGSIGIGRFRYHEQLEFYYCFTHVSVDMRRFAVAVLRFLAENGGALAHAAPGVAPFGAVRANLGEGHAFHHVMRRLIQRDEAPYAWLVRVPSYPDLLQAVAPFLEERLARSAWAGHSGQIHVSWYRAGIQITLTNGRISVCDAPAGAPAQASYPPHVFLQQVFGLRSLAELRAAYMDVRVEPAAAEILDVLFPKQPSWLLPLD